MMIELDKVTSLDTYRYNILYQSFGNWLIELSVPQLCHLNNREKFLQVFFFSMYKERASLTRLRIILEDEKIFGDGKSPASIGNKEVAHRK